MAKLIMDSNTFLIDWNKNLKTGLDELDVIHQKLFTLIDELSHSDSENVMSIFDDLRHFVLSHYQYEKNSLQKQSTHLEYQRLHLTFHKNYIDYLDQIKSIILESPAEVNHISAFLLKWLKWHITFSDTFWTKKIIHPELESIPEETDWHQMAEFQKVYCELGQKILEIAQLNLRINNKIAKQKMMESNFALSNAQLQAMINFSNSLEYWEDPDGKIKYVSPSCERITGYPVNDFLENPDLLYDIIYPEDRYMMEKHRVNKAFQEENEQEVFYRINKRDGNIIHVAHNCHVIYDQENRLLGRRGSIRDRTELQQKVEQQQLAETVFTSVNEAVLVTDRNWNILRINPSFSKITGKSFDEVKGSKANLLFDNTEERIQRIVELVEEIGFWEGEVLGYRKDKPPYDCWISIYSVKNQGQLLNHVLVFSDISDKKKNDEKIYKLAHFDLLTDLPNRTLFLERLRQAILQAKRQSHLLALMFVDLDKFKLVNDTLGHYIGDLLLKEVANRLNECIRQSDTAARIGGDEFVILLPTITSEEDAKKVGEKILERVREDYLLDGNLVNVGVSIGIAIFPLHGKTHEELLTNADAAMYQAKHGGGHSLISFSELSK